MKAEHRKELQTNVLADRIGKIVDAVKHPPSTTSVVAWVIGGLAVATLILWMWFTRSSDATAPLWAKLEADSYNKPEDWYTEGNEAEVLRSLAEISNKHGRTVPGRTARFQEARFLLPLG